MAARKTVRRGRRKKPVRKRRHPVATFVFMVLLSALLMWGVVAISQRGGDVGGLFANGDANHGDASHGDEITDEDRQRLDDVFKAIENERAKP